MHPVKSVMILFKQYQQGTALINSMISGVTNFTLCLLLTTASSCREKEKPVVYGKNSTAGKYEMVNGIKIYYEIYGEGKPLLLLHGNGGSIYSMCGQIPYFSKHYKVIAIDSRSQGNSKDDSDSLSYDMMAADVNALMNQLKIDSAYVIGQSDGAIVGLMLAAQYPAKVKMLAAMSPNIRPDSVVLYPQVEAASIKDFTTYQDSVNAGFKALAGKLKLMKLMHDHPHISSIQLQNIKAPVLIMSGDRDVIQLNHIIEIFRAIQKSNLCVLPGSTHFALRQNTQVFNETIDRFFSRPFGMPDSFVH